MPGIRQQERNMEPQFFLGGVGLSQNVEMLLGHNCKGGRDSVAFALTLLEQDPTCVMPRVAQASGALR